MTGQDLAAETMMMFTDELKALDEKRLHYCDDTVNNVIALVKNDGNVEKAKEWLYSEWIKTCEANNV